MCKSVLFMVVCRAGPFVLLHFVATYCIFKVPNWTALLNLVIQSSYKLYHSVDSGQ